MKELIARGAEAILYVDKGVLVKERIRKKYRIPQIDKVLRRQRTKKEARIMQKVTFAPKILDVDDKWMRIKMELIDGLMVKDVMDALPSSRRKKLCMEIGRKIAELHDDDIIHGDLTTSNMMLKKGKLYFIDFGLSFISAREEDKAVDLHLLKQALESRHWNHFAESYRNVLSGYRKSKNHKAVLKRLEKVEARGRYKQK